MMKISIGEATLEQHLKVYKIPFEREFKFHPTRRWKFDFILTPKLAVECEGGIWSGGAHTRGKHFEEDCIKYAEAALLGYTVLRFSTGQIQDGTAIDYIKKILGK